MRTNCSSIRQRWGRSCSSRSRSPCSLPSKTPGDGLRRTPRHAPVHVLSGPYRPRRGDGGLDGCGMRLLRQLRTQRDDCGPGPGLPGTGRTGATVGQRPARGGRPHSPRLPIRPDHRRPSGASDEPPGGRFAVQGATVEAITSPDPTLEAIHRTYADTYQLEDAYLRALAAALPDGDFSDLPDTQDAQRQAITAWRKRLQVLAQQTGATLPDDLQQAGRGEIAPRRPGADPSRLEPERDTPRLDAPSITHPSPQEIPHVIPSQAPRATGVPLPRSPWPRRLRLSAPSHHRPWLGRLWGIRLDPCHGPTPTTAGPR